MRIFRFCLRVLLALIYSGAIAVGTDVLATMFFSPISMNVFLALFIISFLILLLLKPLTDRLWIAIPLCVAAGLVVVASMYGFYYKGDYTVVDNGKEALYSGKDVLVLVPHQDDELLVAGGVIEEYIKYGSSVSLAFSTNGDAIKPGETRLKEALQVAQVLGIPENQVFFLGYGDRCSDGIHIYNHPDDDVVASQAGFTSTYALPEHPAYRQDRLYTKGNIRSDLKELLLEVDADIICCVEYELHPDHSALAMLLDEAMAELLREGSDYRPIILKSSCYATGFYAPEDFHGENLKSTQDPSGGEFFSDMYNWEDRLRLPINGSGLSRSVFGCDAFQQFSLHKSQNIKLQSEGAINGDKVFWLRDTNSLCYIADVSTSSGISEFLNDFKLFDSYDITASLKLISDNTWVPAADDSKKTAFVSLEEPSYIQRICLYDDPDKTSNVLNALITFDDGSSIETGALNKNSVTEIIVEKDNVKCFSVKLLETQGAKAGLTEIEAYSSQIDYGFDFIKVQNMQGDFVYDYYIDKKGEESFTVYSSGVDGEFKVTSDNPNCSVKYENQVITVKCPKGQRCVITVTSDDGRYSDTVVISNPGRFMRETGPWLEQSVRQFRKYNIQYCNSYQIIRNAYHLVKPV